MPIKEKQPYKDESTPIPHNIHPLILIDHPCFITKLPLSNMYDTILIVMDTFSKASIFILCNETIDTEKTALLYTTYVLPHYGLPSCIISDQDP